MTLSVNEARFGYNHVTSHDAANENMSIVGPGVYLDPLYGSKCAMSFSSANSLVIGTGAVWANGHYVTIKSPKTVSIANGQSGYKRNDIVCIHCHIDDFGQESATESYELVVKQGTQTTGTPDDPVIVNDAISNLVEDSYAPIARVKLEGLVPTVEPLMTMLPALMDLITTGRIENKAVTKSKLADHCVGQQQLETSVWDSISHQSGFVDLVAPVGESIYSINYSFAKTPQVFISTFGLRGSLGKVFVGAVDKNATGCSFVVRNNGTAPVGFKVSWLAVL